MKIADIIEKSYKTLRSGGVLLYPTDTIWGIGADIRNEAACHQVFHIKQRDLSQPLIYLVSSIEMLKEYTIELHPRIETLLFYHNKPLTLIHKASDKVFPWARTKEGTIAFRVTTDGFCKRVVETLGRPISSTSANISGEAFPVCYTDVSKDIISQVDGIANPYPNKKGSILPSVIAKYDDEGQLIIIRE